MAEERPAPNLLIGIGGTGQVALHHELVSHYLGEGLTPFRALVIDQDALNGDLAVGREFFDELALGDRILDGTPRSWIRDCALSVPDAKGTVLANLTKHKSTSPSVKHPVEAFVDQRTLGQDLTGGLYRRPALASLLWGRARTTPPTMGSALGNTIDTAVNECKVGTKLPTIVVIAGISGGCGGGLLVPVVRHIRRAFPEIRVHVVAYMRWFTVDPAIDHAHDSNDNGVAAVMREGFMEGTMCGVRSAVVVRSQEPQKRNPGEEKDGNIEWPSSAGPFRDGSTAVRELIRDTTQERPSTLKLLSIAEGAAASYWARLEERRRAAAAAVEYLLSEPVIETCAWDLGGKVAYGRRVPGMLGTLWQQWIAEGNTKWREFPGHVGRHLQARGADVKGKLLKLKPTKDRSLFIRLARSLPAPSDDDFGGTSPGDLAKSCASSLLYFLARGGGAA